ncbi:hypothetical protein [Aliikangiella coralliicola]|uniref:Uncharacterized protein n=1 Tax=Aliikangiella coralliicola TaxID=2592383 RepID=A0A545U781_9GAMM|nr:hypothetical protein [Aliikangiella coralliicola]TQV85310.1 hypothetical protein FLL46_19275 [Aliikangiella coralliicola]
MKVPEEKINLNGEFLGISALAIYSAPWYLQLPLLMLVALMFFFKISHHSSEIKKLVEHSKSENELDEFLSNVNYFFFGFAVPRKNVSAYWTGLTIYFITLIYALFNLYLNLIA